MVISSNTHESDLRETLCGSLELANQHHQSQLRHSRTFSLWCCCCTSFDLYKFSKKDDSNRRTTREKNTDDSRATNRTYRRQKVISHQHHVGTKRTQLITDNDANENPKSVTHTDRRSDRSWLGNRETIENVFCVSDIYILKTEQLIRPRKCFSCLSGIVF